MGIHPPTADGLLPTLLVNRERPRKPLSLATLPPGVAVFVGVVLLRLIVLLRLTSSPFLLPARGDMHFYNDWALRILGGEWTDHLAFYALPLYAYGLAAIYWLFGYSPFVPGFIQACLEAGTATLLFQCSITLFRRNETGGAWIGATAAAGWAILQPAQAYAAILMPTAWLVFVYWLVVYQVIRCETLPRPYQWLLGGLLIGVMAMAVANVLFLVPLLVAAVLWKWNPRALSTSGIALAALLIGIGIGTAPAWIHNRFVAHDPVFLSAHSGINFWIGNNPYANGYPRFPPGLRAGQSALLQDSIAGAEAAAGRPLKRSEVSAYWSAKARHYIAQNPGAWLRLMALKLRNFWNAFPYDDVGIITNLREHGIIFPGPGFGLVAALGLAGMSVAVASIAASRWIAAAILLHMCSLLTVFVTDRYRLAAAPGLMIFAAYGLWLVFESCRDRKLKPLLAYLGALALATLFVSLPQRDPGPWALDAYNSGIQALEMNELARAERKLMLAHDYVPENAETNFALGNLRLAQGRPSEAERHYAATLALDHAHRGALSNLGVIQLQAGRWELAAQCFRSALATDPGDAKTHYLLAKAAAGAGDLATALSEIEQAIALNPAEPEFGAFRQELQQRPP